MNREMFDKVLVDNYKALMNFCSSLAKNKEEAEDLCHDTIIRAMENCALYYPDNPSAWLCTIAKNIFINNKKKKKIEIAEAEFAEDRVAREYVDINEAIESYGQILENIEDILTPDLREVWLAREHGYNNEAVALMLGIPVGTVKSRYSVACRKVRKYWEDMRNE